MFVVLVTDFVSVQEVYGPFDSQEAAHEWAEINVDDVYRVFEVKPPAADPAPAVVVSE